MMHRSDYMIRFPLSMKEQHHDLIRELAHKNKTSMAEEIRKAIDEYLRKENGHGSE
jgi:hypothetical protein